MLIETSPSHGILSELPILATYSTLYSSICHIPPRTGQASKREWARLTTRARCIPAPIHPYPTPHITPEVSSRSNWIVHTCITDRPTFFLQLQPPRCRPIPSNNVDSSTHQPPQNPDTLADHVVESRNIKFKS